MTMLSALNSDKSLRVPVVVASNVPTTAPAICLPMVSRRVMSAAWVLLAALWVAVLFASPALAQESRVALLTGSLPFGHGRVVPDAVNGAEAMQTTLQRLGLGLTLVRNQGVADMQRALRDFSGATSRADVSPFFSAGHGLQAQQIALVAQPALPPSASLGLDQASWQNIQASQRIEEFEADLWQVPHGTFSGLPRARVAALRAPLPPAPAPVQQMQPVMGVRPQSTGYPVPVGQSFQDCPECPEMVVIPAGSFMMGGPANEAGRSSTEGPQRRVTLRQPLALGRFPVTVGQFRTFVEATGYQMTGDKGCTDYFDFELILFYSIRAPHLLSLDFT